MLAASERETSFQLDTTGHNTRSLLACPHLQLGDCCQVGQIPLPLFDLMLEREVEKKGCKRGAAAAASEAKHWAPTPTRGNWAGGQQGNAMPRQHDPLENS